MVQIRSEGGSIGQFYNREIKGRYTDVMRLGDDVVPETAGGVQ